MSHLSTVQCDKLLNVQNPAQVIRFQGAPQLQRQQQRCGSDDDDDEGAVGAAAGHEGSTLLAVLLPFVEEVEGGPLVG